MGLSKHHIHSLWGIIGRAYLDYDNDSISVQEYLYNNIGKLRMLLGSVDKKDIESILPILIRKQDELIQPKQSVVIYHDGPISSNLPFVSPFGCVTG